MCRTANAAYQVGHYYTIPCVRGRLYDAIGWRPVMGEAHRDTEIIGFAPLHYHVDWRFVSEARYNRYVRRIGFGLGRGESIEAHAVPLMLMPEPGRNVRRIESALGELERGTKRLKCKRPLPPYPYADARWIPALSASMAAACLKRGVCPHRGYDLSREPVVDGVVTCPLHGLRWSVETGRVVMPDAPHPHPHPSSAAARAEA